MSSNERSRPSAMSTLPGKQGPSQREVSRYAPGYLCRGSHNVASILVIGRTPKEDVTSVVALTSRRLTTEKTSPSPSSPPPRSYSHPWIGAMSMTPQRMTTPLAVAVLMLLACVGPVVEVAARTHTPSETESSDMTLTESPTESKVYSRSFTYSPTPDDTITARTLTMSSSVTPSFTKTPSSTSDQSLTPHTQTRTASPDDSDTVTVSSDASGYSNTTLMTESGTITVSSDDSASRSQTLSGDATESGAAARGTLTLTDTVTMTESITLTSTGTITPSEFTPSLTKEHTRTSTKTPSGTLVVTEDASWSSSQSNTPTFSPEGPSKSVSMSLSESLVTTATETGTATIRDTTTRTVRITPTNTESLTEVKTHTLVTISESRSLQTLTQEMSASARSISASLTSTVLPKKHRKALTITLTMTLTLSHRMKRSISPTAGMASRTYTFSEYLSPTSSDTFTGISASQETTKTLTLLDSITTTGTVSVSSTTSRSEATESDMKTKSVTGSRTHGSWETSATTTETTTASRDLTPTAKTSTLTLTMSARRQSRTRRISPTTSVSSTEGTLTNFESSTFTVTDDLTPSILTYTLSKMTRESTATLTPSSEPTRASRSVSASQVDRSRSLSATASPSSERTRASFSLSVSSSIRTVTARVTITRIRRGAINGSVTASPSPQQSITITDSATMGSQTHTIPRFTSLDNSLVASIGAVLFPSLQESTAPCMSLALYVVFPLFLILLVQLLLWLISTSLHWKVSCDTHRHVPMWRSLLITTSYAGFLVPCHLRCAYAHTLRLMVQVLVLLVVLECLVDQLNPQANNVAAFCAALAIVITQVIKPITHAAYTMFRFPKDEELSAQMHLAQMKRIVKLRKKENLAAKRAERERRRLEGLDDVSTTTDEEPEFAFDPENAVSFDYLDGASGRRGGDGQAPFSNPSLNELHFGRDMDLEFPIEHEVFTNPGMDYQLPTALGEGYGPGYIDVSYPGEERLQVVDFLEENRVSTAEHKRRASFVKDVPSIGSQGGSRGSPPPGLLRKKQSWVDPDRISIGMMSLGSLASFSSPTRAALAVADGRVGSSSSTRKPNKPKKKRIGPGRDGVVVIPEFDDDFGVKELPNSDDEEGDEHWGTATTSTTKHQRSAVQQLTAVSLFSDLDPEDLLDDDDDDVKDDGDFGGTLPAIDKSASPLRLRNDDDDDKISVASSVRYRTEVHPIVTTHAWCSVILLVVVGVLLFAIDRYRHLCATSFNGNFGNLWAISILVDATVGDALVAAIVYLYRRLSASGEEGNYVASFLHPYNGELRARMYEHLSDRFSGKQYLANSSRQSADE